MRLKVDFSSYSLNDLYSSAESVDRTKYPDRAKEIDDLILEKEQEIQESAQKINDIEILSSQSNRTRNIGEINFKLIIVYLKKKHVMPFRFLMLSILFLVLADMYDDWISGEIYSRSSTYDKEHWGFYAALFKQSVIAFACFWFGTLGVKDKNKNVDEKE
jgi:hypothetical protein